MRFVLPPLRVLSATHCNITNTWCHSQQVFSSGCLVKHHQCLRAEVIYEASISNQGGSRCLQKALRITLRECEQIHQSGLSLRPKVLSRGWPSFEFHHWDMEHNCECVLKDKGLICQEGDEVSACASASHMWLRITQRYPQFHHTNLYKLHLVEGFATTDSLLSPIFLACGDLGNVTSSSFSIYISVFFFFFNMRGRRGERRPDMTDQWWIKGKKLDPTVHSIIHSTSANTISINSVKTHFHLVRNTSFNGCDMYLLQVNSIISVSQLEILFAENKGRKSVLPFKHFFMTTHYRAKYLKNLELGPR